VTTPLRRNRDFQLLWAGQAISALGSRASGVALPLLVLGLTGSPARAGATMLAGSLPLLLFTLPAGAYLDRVDRKRAMLACDAARAVALASIPAALWLGRLSFAQLLAVAFVEGTGFVVFEIAERAALARVVPSGQLPAAISQNQAREYGAMLLGQPLGGVLFGLGRAIPFVADAISYVASAAGLLLVRTQLQGERDPRPTTLRAEIVEGLAFLWRQPLLRTTSLLVTGSDLVINALYLVVIVMARERGASAALIGALFAFVGVGGVLGSLVAPAVARVAPPRLVVLGSLWTVTLLVPLLALVPGAVPLGVLYGAMFAVFPAWNTVIGAYRMLLVPDRLRGRVQAVSTLLALGAVPIGSLVVGVLLEALGSTPTIALLFTVMLVVSSTAFVSRAIRDAPRLEGLGLSADEARRTGRRSSRAA
jgi:predicted MFS family arabinose efflux permease